MKGISIASLSGIAIGIVVLSLMIAIGGEILSSIEQSQCDYTWGTFSVSGHTVPVCCSSVNASNSSDCDTLGNDIAGNVTAKGLTGMQTFGNWIPIIVIVVIAAAIIGLLVAYLGGANKV